MTPLGRKVAFLFWQYPILWVPVLCADVTAYWLNILRSSLAHQMLVWFLPHASVFGNEPAPLTPASEHLALAFWLTTPASWVFWTLSIGLYLTGMVFTARLAQMLLSDERTSLQLINRSVRQQLPRVALLSVIILMLYGLGGALSASAYMLPGRQSPPSTRSIEAIGFFLYLCFATILAPSLLRLLQPSNEQPLAPAYYRLARILAPCTIAAVFVLDLSLPLANRIILEDSGTHIRPVSYLVGMIESMLAAAPYIPLAIAFAILSTNPADQPGVPSETTENPAAP
jgi:hypothetical protein